VYTTRGCFHNPTRDRGRIIGRARAESAVDLLEQPVTIGGREYAIGCELSLLQLLPFSEGVILADLVEQLTVFPRPHA